MRIYFIKRLLYFIPTFFIVSLVAFFLSKNTPGDPVARFCQSEDSRVYDPIKTDEICGKIARSLGLDKPVFYFEISTQAHPDTLYKIIKADEREMLERLLYQYGNWAAITEYYQAVRQLNARQNDLDGDAAIKTRRGSRLLLISVEPVEVESIFNQLKNTIDTANDSLLKIKIEHSLAYAETRYSALLSTATPSKLYIPSLKWYGFDNQYHNWISHFIVGDFGASYTDLRPVTDKIVDAIRWTLMISIISILLAFLIAIPLGVWAAIRKNSLFDRLTTLSLFMWYSLPPFWIATLLLIFFTTSEYGEWTDIFPSIGLGKLPNDAPFWSRFWETASHLILPVFCTTYTVLAFLFRQMRGAMLTQMGQDYIQTARAKGLSEQQVIWKHAFPNALFPMITLLAGIFPAAISGSVIIEVIFNIPGMGRLAFDAIFAQDWPIVFTVLMLGTVLTLIGSLLTDWLYAAIDPRVRF